MDLRFARRIHKENIEQRLRQEKNGRMYERYHTIYLHAVKQILLHSLAPPKMQCTVTIWSSDRLRLAEIAI